MNFFPTIAMYFGGCLFLFFADIVLDVEKSTCTTYYSSSRLGNCFSMFLFRFYINSRNILQVKLLPGRSGTNSFQNRFNWDANKVCRHLEISAKSFLRPGVTNWLDKKHFGQQSLSFQYGRPGEEIVLEMSVQKLFLWPWEEEIHIQQKYKKGALATGLKLVHLSK